MTELTTTLKTPTNNGSVERTKSPPLNSNWGLRKCFTQISDLKDQLFPELSKRSLIRHYLPLSGAISHSLFTAHIFAPQLITRFYGHYDMAISNAILFNSHFGIGFFVFFRPHMYRLNVWDRVEFSVFTSVIYNFGSLLFAILLKNFIPKKVNLAGRIFLGISLSLYSLSRAFKYIRHVDSRTIPFKDVRFEHVGRAS